MTAPTSKQLSRRDALKLLGAAAGASVLANLPSKWSTPQLTAGVLPAHAETSSRCTNHALVLEIIENQIDSFFSVDPTSTDGTLNQTGFKAYWPCGSACIFVFVGSQGAKVTFAVGDAAPYTVELPHPGGGYYWIYLNAGKLQYSDGYPSGQPTGTFTVDGCPDFTTR